MPHWLLKSAVHRAISWLPQRQFWNGLLQEYLTRTTVLTPPMFEVKLRECAGFLQDSQKLGTGARDPFIVEVGTGWYPTVPLGMFLCGASAVWTFDVEPLLNPGRLRQLLNYFQEYDRSGGLKKLLPEVRADRIGELAGMVEAVDKENPAGVLKRANIYVQVRDAQATGLPDQSVDFLFSNSVLQYVPRIIMRGIFEEMRRLAKPGAVADHRLNLEDQFAYFDHSITPFNFLRYTEAQWRWRSSPLIWQNRLRISDIRELLGEAGFEVLKEESVLGCIADLAKIDLAPEFKKYRQEDLLALHSSITARVRR